MKNLTKKITSIFIMLCILLSGITPLSTSAANIKLNKTSITINVKQTYKLKIKGTTKKVTWKSSNKKIAKVSAAGKVTGVKAGEATISATVSGKTYKATVNVVKTTVNTVEEMNKNDFIINYKEDGESITKNLIEMYSGRTWGGVIYTIEDEFITARKIKSGSTATEVEKAYGTTTYNNYSIDDAINCFVEQRNLHSSEWKQCMDYNYSYNGDNFVLRFYINSSKEVDSIIIFTNYNAVNTIQELVSIIYGNDPDKEMPYTIVDNNVVVTIPYEETIKLRYKQVPSQWNLYYMIMLVDNNDQVIEKTEPKPMEYNKDYNVFEAFPKEDYDMSDYKYYRFGIWDYNDSLPYGMEYYFRYEDVN